MMTFYQEILTFVFSGNWQDWLFHWQKNRKKFTFKNQHMTGNHYDPVEFNDHQSKKVRSRIVRIVRSLSQVVRSRKMGWMPSKNGWFQKIYFWAELAFGNDLKSSVVFDRYLNFSKKPKCGLGLAYCIQYDFTRYPQPTNINICKLP